MSDQIVTPEQPNDAPNAKRTTAAKRMEHSAVIAKYAQAHPSDPSAKGLRRTLRANKDADALYRKHAKNTPWPSHSVATLKKLFAHDAAFIAALNGKSAPRKSAKK